MDQLTDVEYIERQLTLEGIGVDRNGRLVRIPATAAEEIPRLYVCRHSAGWSRYYRSDLSEPLVSALERLSDAECFGQQSTVRRLLSADAPSRDVWAGASYIFPTIPPAEASPDVARLTEADRALAIAFDPDLATFPRPIYAALVDGQVVSTCVSVRENDQAAEAWVQTAPAFRRRGLARQVTAAWARDVRCGGKVAFYSHLWENAASAGVARALALYRFVDAVGYL